MKTLQEQFVPYKLAIKLKELGFDEDCFGWYSHINGDRASFYSYPTSNSKLMELNMFPKNCSAPLWQQAFEFFMEKHYFVNIVEHFDCFIDWHSHTLFLVTPKSKDINEVRTKALERIIEHYEADELRRIEIYNEK